MLFRPTAEKIVLFVLDNHVCHKYLPVVDILSLYKPSIATIGYLRVLDIKNIFWTYYGQIPENYQ